MPQAVLGLIRPPLLIMVSIFVAIGAVSPGQILPFDQTLISGWVLMAFLVVYGTAVNDISDVEVDRINLPESSDRPLASGLISKRQMWFLAAISAGVAVGIGAFSSLGLLSVILAGLILPMIYSFPPFQLSHRSVGPFLLPLWYVTVPFLIGAVGHQQPIPRTTILLLAGLYVCFIGRIILKDFRDSRGDALYHKQTFYLQYGRTATLLVSGLAWLTGAAILASVNWLLGLTVGVGLPFVFYALFLLNQSNNRKTDRALIWSIARIASATMLVILMIQQTQGEPLLYQAGLVAMIALPFAGMYFSEIRKHTSLAKSLGSADAEPTPRSIHH